MCSDFRPAFSGLAKHFQELIFPLVPVYFCRSGGGRWCVWRLRLRGGGILWMRFQKQLPSRSHRTDWAGKQPFTDSPPTFARAVVFCDDLILPILPRLWPVLFLGARQASTSSGCALTLRLWALSLQRRCRQDDSFRPGKCWLIRLSIFPSFCSAMMSESSHSSHPFLTSRLRRAFWGRAIGCVFEVDLCFIAVGLESFFALEPFRVPIAGVDLDS